MGWLGGFLRRLVLGVFCDSAGGVFCDSGRVFGYGKRGFLHQWWFSATVTGVYYIGAGPQRSVGWLGFFFATVGVGGFLRQCWEGFLRQWKGSWLRQGVFLHQWWFSATVTGVYYVGGGRQRSGASRRHLRGRL